MTGNNALEGRRVLVVEDELMIALDLCSKLESLGCIPVGPVPSIDEALALLEAQRPDVALLDENLRDLPVTPVANALQQRRIPFALVSGFSRPRTPDPVLGEAPRLVKPTSAGMLVAMLEKLCNSSHG